MSTGQKMNILKYLPQEEQHKILQLVQRLKEESDAREKYEGLYRQSQAQLQALTLKYNQTRDQNKLLKGQIHNSFSIVSQVRANFHANKQKMREGKARDDGEWEDQSDDENQENQQNSVNQTTLNNRPPRVTIKSPLQKYRPPMTTSKKTPNILNLSGNELNSTNLNSSRSKDILDLKKQIRGMQEQKRKSGQKKKEMTEKIRLVDQIKNRYKLGDESMRRSSDARETIIERIDITNAFENEEVSMNRPREAQKMVETSKKQVREVVKKAPMVVAVKERQSGGVSQGRYTSPGKGHVITAEDYDDVMDLINCQD